MYTNYYKFKVAAEVYKYYVSRVDFAKRKFADLVVNLVDHVDWGGVEKSDDGGRVKVKCICTRRIYESFGKALVVGRGMHDIIHADTEVFFELTTKMLIKMQQWGDLYDVEWYIIYDSVKGGQLGIYAHLKVKADSCEVHEPRTVDEKDGGTHVIGPVKINDRELGVPVLVCGKPLNGGHVEIEELRYLEAREWRSRDIMELV